MTDPDVTVVIPHYNDPAGLALCLDALDRQTLPRERFEVIVGDNDSPCGRDVVERAIAGRARLVIVAERGAGPARNGAAALARGSSLAFVDSDCVPAPGWLAAGIAAIGLGTFAGGRMIVSVRDPARLSGAEAFELAFAFRNDDYVRAKGFTVTANLFVTRADFERVGPFRTGVSEDVEWCQRARRAGLRIVYAEHAVVAHPARTDWAGLLKKWRRTTEEGYELMREAPGGRLRWLVRTLAMPASIVAHAPRILANPAIRGARTGAFATLVRLRLDRTLFGLRLLARKD